MRAHMSGVSDSDTMPLAKMAITIVMLNSRKIRPISPDRNTSGMNTAASDTVMLRIVKLISRAPRSAASSGGSPNFSIRRTAFSRNTIASSTRNPMASVSAISDRLSRL
jgi:hypothetical protein